MIKIKFQDQSVQEFNAGTTAGEIIKSKLISLYKSTYAVKIDDKVCDLRTAINEDAKLIPLTFNEIDGKKAYWHTTAHILAQAVKRLYPDVKLAIGPAIDTGFYYDFDLNQTFTPEDLKEIESLMKTIIKENLKIERFELTPDEAIKLMEESGEKYKVELIKEHAKNGEPISFYKQGEFIDLCRGPHLMSTGQVKAIKLTNCTGAYWRGDSKSKMLQRIYGVSFPKSSELEKYIEAVEQAKKRDHNKLGRELGYFTTVDYIGQGLPIMLQNGSRVLQILQRFVEDEEQKRGYILTKTPFMAKNDLYKISGHWDHYRDNMFILNGNEQDNETLALRPMTCPFQFQVYLSKKRSYRDLPMRLNETSTLFRNEASGEMHGLIRVRQFTISEGHIACTPDQLENEFTQCLDLALYMLKTLGLSDDVYYRFSKWDENDRDKYIGNHEDWENVQNRMRNILDNLNIKYEEANGEAAFYGPKLDVQIKNVYGKEDTLITLQIDFQLAERFNMLYTDKDGQEKYPYVIHRTSIGCYERTLALLIEKYAGALPTWLMAEQVRILPISEKFFEYSEKIKQTLLNNKIRVTLDNRNEKIGYKIREAQIEKIPYMIIIGNNEVNEKLITVRHRKKGDMGKMSLEEFNTMLQDEIDQKLSN